MRLDPLALRPFRVLRSTAIGDWLVDGKRHYGDGLYKRAAEIMGLTEGTLRNFASVASTFEMSWRHDKLAYQLHIEVASLKQIHEADDGKLYLSDEPDRDKIADKRRAYYAKQAKGRQREHGGTAPGKKQNTGGKFSTSVKAKSRDQVGKVFGVSGKSVDKARKVRESGPPPGEGVGIQRQGKRRPAPEGIRTPGRP